MTKEQGDKVLQVVAQYEGRLAASDNDPHNSYRLWGELSHLFTLSATKEEQRKAVEDAARKGYGVQEKSEA